MKALSIQQPWASLIVAGLKDIENRTWWTSQRGRILVHAGKREDTEGLLWLANNWHQIARDSRVGDIVECQVREKGLPRGSLIGMVDVTGCVSEHQSAWFNGPYGHVLANAEAFATPIPYKGALGYFDVPWPLPDSPQSAERLL